MSNPPEKPVSERPDESDGTETAAAPDESIIEQAKKGMIVPGSTEWK